MTVFISSSAEDTFEDSRWPIPSWHQGELKFGHYTGEENPRPTRNTSVWGSRLGKADSSLRSE
jgi:hypothetical protein